MGCLDDQPVLMHLAGVLERPILGGCVFLSSFASIRDMAKRISDYAPSYFEYLDRCAKRGVYFSFWNNMTMAPSPDRYHIEMLRGQKESAMRTSTLVVLLLFFTAEFTVLPYPQVLAGPAEDVQSAMQLLKSKAAALGAPSIKGDDTVAGKTVPALYFGEAKMNNNFSLVDEVQREKGGTATIFVKNGDDFVRVATNVKKDNGSRAIGTVLDPKGKAIAAIAKGESFYGDVDILGKPYTTGYEPIRDASNNIIGVYYVGYLKT